MFKKILITLALVLIPTITLAAEANPTVKVTSYKYLFSDHIIAFGSGSGTVIDPSGIILTNNHVIYDESEEKPLDAFEVCITFEVQKEPVCAYMADLIANDKDMDLAILKLRKKDVFGNPVPSLPFISHRNNSEPKEGDDVKVLGYPGSGGDTITITQGQISGFDEYNGFTYFKTDTDFDHGSSGGTVLDDRGNLIGVPTYIRTYAENVGYFLDLREAKDWISMNMNDGVQANERGDELLTKHLARLKTADDTKKLSYQNYPNLSVKLPEDWHFMRIEDSGFYAEQKNKVTGVGLQAQVHYYPFEIDDRYMNRLNEELSKIKKQRPDYKKEVVTLAGEEAWKITYSHFNQRQVIYYIPYGYALVSLSTLIDLDEEGDQVKAFDSVLDSLEFGGKEESDPNLSKILELQNPHFSITMNKGWRIQKNADNQPIDLLAEGVQDNNFDGSFQISYRYLSPEEQQRSVEDRFKEDAKSLEMQAVDIIYKKENGVIDGRQASIITYEYEGNDYQKNHKKLVIKMPDDQYQFEITYDDLSENFDKNLEDIKTMLESIQLGGNGIYEIGSLNHLFSDIDHHRFAGAILELADKEIVTGYSDGTFKPEETLTRAEALRIILNSKNHLEKEKGLGEDINFSAYADQKSFSDVPTNKWFSGYIAYAKKEDLLDGYSKNTFRPNQTINLVEGVKMILSVYEIPVWDGETNPWYKKYMDKGYELGLIPRGLDDAGIKLTRAELSEMVNRIYNQAR